MEASCESEGEGERQPHFWVGGVGRRGPRLRFGVRRSRFQVEIAVHGARFNVVLRLTVRGFTAGSRLWFAVGDVYRACEVRSARLFGFACAVLAMNAARRTACIKGNLGSSNFEANRERCTSNPNPRTWNLSNDEPRTLNEVPFSIPLRRERSTYAPARRCGRRRMLDANTVKSGSPCRPKRSTRTRSPSTRCRSSTSSTWRQRRPAHHRGGTQGARAHRARRRNPHNALRKGGRIFLVGAGTSGRLGVVEAAEMPPTFGTPPKLVQAIMAGGQEAVFRAREGVEDNFEEGARSVARLRVTKRDVIIGVSASGITQFVRGALTGARKGRASSSSRAGPAPSCRTSSI